MQRLLTCGFIPKGNDYMYSVGLLGGQFKMTVTVSAEGSVSTKVLDVSLEEEYVLHRIAGSSGAFAGSIKAEYEAVLRDISERCFDRDTFKSEYAKKIIQYVRETYQDELEYLWERFPANAIWRRKDNYKWYGALLAVSKRKLGIDSDEMIDIIDLRIEMEKLEAIVDGKRYFPGYHMNKKHWFTICLDGSVQVEEIFKWIDLSYEIAAKK